MLENADWAHSPNETGQPEPLLEHLQLVAQLCEQFASRFGAGSWGHVAGLWHDLGKFSREFQSYIRGLSRDRIDHSSAGAQYAYKNAGDVGKLLACCIAGHHDGLPDYHGEGGERSVLSERLSKHIPDYLSYAPSDLLAAQLARALPVPIDKDEALFQLSFLTRMLFSCLVDADFLATENFLNGTRHAQRRPGASIAELAAVLNEYLETLQANAAPTEVNRLRSSILASCIEAASSTPGFFSLTVPTGGGKTLASLTWALRHAQQYGLDRVIVVLPYMNIIEQTADIYRKVFRKFGGATVIEHHSTADYEKGPFALRLATENWDATIIVTTAVQFFDSLFANKPGKCRKLHRIAQSVVILDEAQTLPVGLLAPCLSALRALVKGYQTSVLLCTATQPALGRRDNFPIGLLDVREIIP